MTDMPLMTPLLRAVLDLLEKKAIKEGAAEPEEMQHMIEMLCVMHCARTDNRADAHLVADAMHKHVTQILDVVFEGEEGQSITGTIVRFQ